MLTVTERRPAPMNQGSSLFSLPSKVANRYVLCYLQRELQLGRSTVIQPVPARTARLLDFEFGDPVKILCPGTGITRTAEPAALVGLQTYQHYQLLLCGNVKTFVIVFRPAAIHQLFGLPAHEFVNCDHAAHAVLGTAVSILREQLGNALSFQGRVQIADEFISSRIFAVHAIDPVEQAANEILHNHGGCRIDSLAHQTGLSVRNFQRMFQQRIGVPPKLFARVVRFEAALKTKAALPQMSWTTIAHRFGYHDQMHMIHDFQNLSGETPARILCKRRPCLSRKLILPPRTIPSE